MVRPRHVVTALLLICLFAAVGLAQDKEKIKYLTPTHKGSTGLFNLSVADTLRPGEYSLGINSYRINREPGDMYFTIFPVSFTVGVHKRIELFASLEAYKQVHSGDLAVDKMRHINPWNGVYIGPAPNAKDPRFPDPKDPYAKNFVVFGPNDPKIVPSRLVSLNANKQYVLAWYNDAPFMDLGYGDGLGSLWVGLKANLLSERWGDPVGLALQPIARFSLIDSREYMARGLTTGVTDAGFDMIMSKNLPKGATLTGSAGLLLADDIAGVDRQHRFNYGLGADLPIWSKKAHLVTELVGSVFFGSRGPGVGNPVSPLDLLGGFRVFPSQMLSLSGAYTLTLRTLDRAVYGIDPTNRNGWFAQIAFQRKINEPPTITCTIDKATLIEGDSATVKATVLDPDDDVLSVTWKSTAGRLTQQENSAVFDSRGLKPGKYAITGEVSDGESTAACSSDVTVEKRKMPPTITCAPTSVTLTEGESATIRATASDPNNDPLTYTWTVDGQAVPNNQPEFVFGSAGKALGAHTIRVTVSDVDGMTASCESTVTINRKPNRCPSVTLTLDKTEVYAGEVVTATARAADPDGDPLRYTWTVDGQSRAETGTQIQINTSGMAGGSHTVAVRVRDDRDCAATDTKSFSMREKIVIPIDKIKPDNVAKAKLDEVALKMQQDPRLKAIVTGYSDSKGTDKAIEKAAMGRADAVKDYLVKQHKIDATRIETRSGGKNDPIGDNSTEEGRKQNRRVQIELLVP